MQFTPLDYERMRVQRGNDCILAEGIEFSTATLRPILHKGKTIEVNKLDQLFMNGGGTGSRAPAFNTPRNDR